MSTKGSKAPREAPLVACDTCEGEADLERDEEDVEDADNEQYLEAKPPCPPKWAHPPCPVVHLTHHLSPTPLPLNEKKMPAYRVTRVNIIEWILNDREHHLFFLLV